MMLSNDKAERYSKSELLLCNTMFFSPPKDCVALTWLYHDKHKRHSSPKSLLCNSMPIMMLSNDKAVSAVATAASAAASTLCPCCLRRC